MIPKRKHWTAFSLLGEFKDEIKEQIKSVCEFYLKYKDDPMLLVRDWNDDWNNRVGDVFEFIDRFSYGIGKNKKAWKQNNTTNGS